MSNPFQNFFDGREDKKPVENDTEYLKDNLKYCKICNQPKQCHVEAFGKIYTMPTPCNCQKQKFAKLEEQKKLTELETKIKKSRSNIDDGYRNITFETLTKPFKFAKTYVTNFEKYKSNNIGLMLLGNKGTGKTSASACIVNALSYKSYDVMMITASELINKIGRFDTSDFYTDLLQKVDLAVLDDFGAQRDSNFVREQLDKIIDIRYSIKKPLIITSNLTLDDLSDTDANLSRAYDRLKEMCHPIIFKGESFRKEKANKRLKDLSSELGLKVEV